MADLSGSFAGSRHQQKNQKSHQLKEAARPNGTLFLNNSRVKTAVSWK